MKSLPEETTAERVKLMSQKIKIQKIGTGIKILSPNKLLTKLPVLLAQVKLEIFMQSEKRNQTNTIQASN